jgi:hypothetical protein
MRKNTHPNPRTTESYSAEINTDNYPYYRFIPVAHIEEKQRKIIDRYRIAQEVKAPPYSYSAAVPYYEEAIPQNLPILDLVPTEKPNTYEVDLRNLEDKLHKVQDEIDVNSYKITQQEEQLEENDKKLAQQAQQLNSNSAVIQNNTVYIQQQIHCYTHNASVIHQQGTTIHNQNAEIAANQEQIHSLQEQIYDLQAQVESCQGQLAYHASMLSAFNTLMQNPAYFSQLMVSAMGQQPETVE